MAIVIKTRPLIDALNDCIVACNYCATACLDEDNIKMLAKCIKQDMDCALICQLAATLLSRGSEHGKHVLNECLEVCDLCATECEKHAKMGMEHCENCAAACRKCIEACNEYKMAA